MTQTIYEQLGGAHILMLLLRIWERLSQNLASRTSLLRKLQLLLRLPARTF